VDGEPDLHSVGVPVRLLCLHRLVAKRGEEGIRELDRAWGGPKHVEKRIALMTAVLLTASFDPQPFTEIKERVLLLRGIGGRAKRQQMSR
jgi:hypothetical protein